MTERMTGINEIEAAKLRFEINRICSLALATGKCLSCDADLPFAIRWCGHECRLDYALLELKKY